MDNADNDNPKQQSIPCSHFSWPIKNVKDFKNSRMLISNKFHLTWYKNEPFKLVVKLTGCLWLHFHVSIEFRKHFEADFIVAYIIRRKKGIIAGPCASRLKEGLNYCRVPVYYCETDKSAKKIIISKSESILIEFYVHPLFPFDFANMNIIQETTKREFSTQTSNEFCNNTLSQDFHDLFKSGDKTDLTITAGNTKFPVHRFILTARSSVFAAMFSNEMGENIREEINMEFADPKVVEEMLRYIYCDSIQNLDAVVFDLIVAADKFKLRGLYVMCIDYLCDAINVGSVIPSLLLANRLNANDLKQRCMEFIKKNSSSVIGTDLFREMLVANGNLAQEICSCLSSDSTEPQAEV